MYILQNMLLLDFSFQLRGFLTYLCIILSSQDFATSVNLHTFAVLENVLGEFCHTWQ